MIGQAAFASFLSFHLTIPCRQHIKRNFCNVTLTQSANIAACQTGRSSRYVALTKTPERKAYGVNYETDQAPCLLFRNCSDKCIKGKIEKSSNILQLDRHKSASLRNVNQETCLNVLENDASATRVLELHEARAVFAFLVRLLLEPLGDAMEGHVVAIKVVRHAQIHLKVELLAWRKWQNFTTREPLS